MQAHWYAHRQARGFLVKLTSVLCTGMCSDTLREILGIRPGSSARPSCCNKMGNPVCVSCHLIFPPRGCSSCARHSLVFVSATWVSTLAFCLSLSVKQGLRWEVFLLLIKCLDNVNLFLASYSKYYSTTKGNVSGPEAAGRVGGEGQILHLGTSFCKTGNIIPVSADL